MTATAPSVHRADEVSLYLGLRFDLLIYAYVRWRAEDLFPLIFHECPELTLNEWLDWNYRPTVEPVGCWLGDDMIGIGWIFQAYQVGESMVAEVGAAFFRGTPAAAWHEALDRFLQHAFVDRGYNEIYGLSWEQNPYSRVILRHCGMERTTSVPWGQEIPADTMIYKLDRQTWEARQRP